MFSGMLDLLKIPSFWNAYGFADVMFERSVVALLPNAINLPFSITEPFTQLYPSKYSTDADKNVYLK